MAHYRLYFYDRAGHIDRAEDVDVSNDKDASAKARALDHAFCIEVWRGTTMVDSIHPMTGRSRRTP